MSFGGVTNAETLLLTLVPDSDTSGESRSIEGRDLETHLIAERERFLRAGLVTPLPGGPGIVPTGTTTGAQGALLKRD